MKLSEAAYERIAAAALQAIREDGVIIVPRSPTGPMIKAGQHVAPDLTDEQIKNIYLLMTNSWLGRPRDVG